MNSTQSVHNQTQERKRPRSYKKMVVYFVCLILSTVMWLFVELMKDYNDVITYSLQFENVPKDLILTNSADNNVQIDIKAQGFELLAAKYLKKNKTLTIDLSDIKYRHSAEGYSAFITTLKLKEELSKQLYFANNITGIKPDTLFFRFSEVFRKTVRVVPDLKYSLNSQYDLVDSVQIYPELITVSSIKSVIDTLTMVTTVPYKIDNIDTNLTIKLPLQKGIHQNLIKFSSDTITVKFSVNQVTEAIYPVSVSVIGDNLKIFPDKVQVYCRVPMNLYKTIEASSFIAQVEYSSDADKKLKVQLVRLPKYIKVLRIEPESVDYILISK